MLLRDILKDVKNSQYRKVITKDKLTSKTKDRNLTEINQERRTLENAYAQALRDGDKSLAKSYSDRLEELRKEAIKAEEKRDEERENFGDAQAPTEEPSNPSHIAATKRESVAKGVAATTGKTTADDRSRTKVKDKLSRLKKTLDNIKDILTQDPLTGKGEEILSNMKEQYGEEKGENVFYASENKGTISGVDKKTKDADDVFIHHIEGGYKVYADGHLLGTYQSESEAENRADEFRRLHTPSESQWNESGHINKDAVTKTPPDKCDYCGGTIGDEFYDAKLDGGSWGDVCKRCFRMHGQGLGVGSGQHYKKTSSGVFEKTNDSKTKDDYPDVDPARVSEIENAIKSLFVSIDPSQVKEISNSVTSKKMAVKKGLSMGLKLSPEGMKFKDSKKTKDAVEVVETLQDKNGKWFKIKKAKDDVTGKVVFSVESTEGGLIGTELTLEGARKIVTKDSKTKDDSLDEMIRKMAREKADVPFNDDGTIRTPQQAQLSYEQWYKILKSRYKNDSRYAVEYGDSKTKDDEREPDQSDVESAQRGNNMVGMSIPDLKDLISSMEGKSTFASKAILTGAKQMLAAKRRMGASEDSKDRYTGVSKEKETEDSKTKDNLFWELKDLKSEISRIDSLVANMANSRTVGANFSPEAIQYKESEMKRREEMKQQAKELEQRIADLKSKGIDPSTV